MRKVKLFPAPHVELRLHVSEEMEQDMRECDHVLNCAYGSGYCAGCSWLDVNIGRLGVCKMPEVRRQVLGGEES